MVDEFSKIQCDEFLARLDNFFIQKNNLPDSKAYFVIAGGKEFLSEKLDIELLVTASVPQRGYDIKQTVILRGNESGPLNTKFWLITPEMDVPDFGESSWNLQMSSKDKPFLLRSEMSQICDPRPIGNVANDLL